MAKSSVLSIKYSAKRFSMPFGIFRFGSNALHPAMNRRSSSNFQPATYPREGPDTAQKLRGVRENLSAPISGKAVVLDMHLQLRFK